MIYLLSSWTTFFLLNNFQNSSVHAYLLSHVIHMLKYHFFCEHVRKIVNEATRALRNGGVPLQVHFISSLAKGKDLIEDVWKKIGNEKFPFFVGMIIITIDRRYLFMNDLKKKKKGKSKEKGGILILNLFISIQKDIAFDLR